MPTAANPQQYQNPGWHSPWGGPNAAPGAAPGAAPWANQPHSFWHPAGMGKPIAIAAIVFLLAAGHIGRMLFWPAALAGLVFLMATGRFGCGRRRWGGNWGQQGQGQGNGPDGGNGNGWNPPWANWCNSGGRAKPASTSGNHAFDEYRAETLRRLEEEQTEFSSFLERLRFAKDKAEFDQFMADRRNRPPEPVPPQA